MQVLSELMILYDVRPVGLEPLGFGEGLLVGLGESLGLAFGLVVGEGERLDPEHAP
jgi:hypothetical protein